MAEKTIITQDSSIFDIVTQYPELKEVLSGLSSNFKRLQNPVLFNTVAKITTVKKASEIGKIYLNEMLYTLNEAIGMGSEYLDYVKKNIPALQDGFLKRRFSAEETLAEKPSWLDNMKTFAEVDARKIDGEPFQFIIEKANAISEGEGFLLIQKFKPAPVMAYLETQGLANYAVKKGEDEWHIYFYKPKSGDKK
ncbi:MAG: DUF1858 domain-containing protein [bacterium]